MQDITGTSIHDKKIFHNTILSSYKCTSWSYQPFLLQSGHSPSPFCQSFPTCTIYIHVSVPSWKASPSLSYYKSWYASFKTHSTDPPSFLRTYTASLFLLLPLQCQKHTAWSTELWHSSPINKQKPSFPNSGILEYLKFYFPTLDLVVNLVILLCLSLLLR